MSTGKALLSQRAHDKAIEELTWYSKKLTQGYGKVRKRFLGEMITGIIRSGECLLSGISRELRLRCKRIHSEEKRLSYELSSSNWDTTRMYKNHAEVVGKEYVDDETVIALDLTDLNKEHGRVYEHVTMVHDGSRGEVVKGYWAIVIEAIKGKGNHLPLLMRAFSDKAKEYRSQFEEIRKAIETVVKEFGKCGLWVMDRGFDSLRNFLYFQQLGVKFLVRGYHDRIVEEHEGEAEHVVRIVARKELRGVDTMFRQYRIGWKGHRARWQKRQVKIRYDYVPLEIVYGHEEQERERARVQLTLMIVEGMGKPGERSFFFTNIPIGTLEECHRAIKQYAKRWSCEEAIRFIKQEFALEDFRVQRYMAIQRMVELAMVCYTFICMMIRRGPQRYKVVYIWLLDLIMQGRKQPHFVHYRLLDAIRKILNLDFFDQSFVQA